MAVAETDTTELETRAINVIRGLAMDMPEAASSGHQGTAMAMAPLAHVLWTRIMRYDASAPEWPDRDRFILSCGHASVLLYSMLHLTGTALSLDDLKAFRQWGSATPGHPERGHTDGVEVTTGPLGQGFANAVGMTTAERWLRARYGASVCDHRTFMLCSDGDLEEGISHEAASFAGHQGLGRLIAIYDDNHISIDGPTELALSDDAATRFAGYGWHTEDVGEIANDCDALEAAIRRAMAVEDRPSLIVVRSHIAWPAPNLTDDAEAHGNGLDAEEISATKKILGLPDEAFWVPDDVRALYGDAGSAGTPARKAWEQRMADWHGDRAAWDAGLAGTGTEGWRQALPSFTPGEKIATRKASGSCIESLVDHVPGLVAGGADLTGNTGTKLDDTENMSAENPGGRQIHYGVREHGMGGIMTGMAHHGGLLPIGGTFLTFSDYMRGSVRLAALSGAKVIYSWTHDSVGLGEDGPTHQPIEHLAALRAMPGLSVIRPADATETAGAWAVAMAADGPTGLILSRQGVPILDVTDADQVANGAYVVRSTDGEADLILIGTGSELSLCTGAADTLADTDGLAVRVVSMPSWDLFSATDTGYRAEVLPSGVPTLAVEAGASLGWERWADASVSIDTFGASAPGGEALARFGFTADNVAERARALLGEPT